MTGYVLIEADGKRHVVGAGTTVGREDCEITLDDSEVSRRHAQFRALDDTLAVEDLGSTNGTFVNGTRITGVVELKDGDTISMGNSELRLEAERDAGATSVSPVRPDPIPTTQPEPVAAPEPVAREPEPPTAPEPVARRPEPEPVARRPEPVASSPEPAPMDGGRARGDVPSPPPVEASRVHPRFTPVAAPPTTAFSPDESGGRRKGSAATKLEATVACYGVILTTAAGIAVYFAQR